MDTVPATAALHIHGAALSDMGKKRENNEDAFILDPDLGLYAVADGMGGHAGGEVASQMAIAALKEATPLAPDREYLKDPSVANRSVLLDWLARTVDSINTAVLVRAQEDRKLHGMGCTLDVVLVRGAGLFIAHVGDSRTYSLRGGALNQMTEDHNLGQALVAGGVITAEQAAAHPQRNVLTRALGPFPTVQVDTSFVDLSPGDKLLLCSDGLYTEVPPERIRDLLAAPPERAAPLLVQAALDGGGRDNVTVVVLYVDQCPHHGQAVIGSQAVREALVRSPLFAGLTEGELLRVQKIATAREVAAGETVMTQDLPCDAIYVLVDGDLSGYRDEDCVGRLEPGDPFGAMSLTEMPVEVSVRAGAAARVLVFPLAEVRGLFTTDTAIAVKLARGALERTAQRLLKVVTTLGKYRKAAQDLAALGGMRNGDS